MSGTPKFSTEDCVQIQRHLRIKMMEDGLTVHQAFDIVTSCVQSDPPTNGHAVVDVRGIPTRVPIRGAITGFVDGKQVIAVPLEDEPAPTPVPSRRDPTVHCEMTHVFANGDVMRCCTHRDCMWGKGKKMHSDGLKYHEAFEETVEADEEDRPEVAELSVTEQEPVRVAGVDKDTEFDPEPEFGSDSELDTELSLVGEGYDD